MNDLLENIREKYPVGVLFAFFICCIVSWLGSIYGLDVYNVISSDGIRWFIANFGYNIKHSCIDETVIAVIALGALQESSLCNTVYALFVRSVRRPTLRQRRALQLTGLAFLLALAVILILLFAADSPLLSAFGTFGESPFAKNIFPLSVLLLFILSLVYGFSSGRFQSSFDALNSSVRLLSRMSFCFFSLLLVSQFVGLLRCVFDVVNTNPLMLFLLETVCYGIPIGLEFRHALKDSLFMDRLADDGT